MPAPRDHLKLVYREANRAARRYCDTPETFIGAGYLGLVTACDRYDASRGALSGFAVPHIRGAILDSERRDASRCAPLEHDVADDRASSLERIEDASVRAAVRSAVYRARLTKLERVVVRRRYWRDEKSKDIAKQIGRSEGRVSQLLSSAHAKLRPFLEVAA